MSELRRERLGLGLQVLDLGMSRTLAACAAGVHVSTLARWRRRQRVEMDLVFRRGRSRTIASEVMIQQASSLVRELHGLVGAESLRRSVPGLTRRAAAAIKQTTCSDVERERRRMAERVKVTLPGIVRGFDSMDVRRPGQPAHLLVAADGSVPFRTSWAVAPRYDGEAVARLFTRDFERQGAPLVVRLDRARQHSVNSVKSVFDRFGVLALHGPAHRPQYYGQLERQNREHRAWLGRGPLMTDATDQTIAAMMSSLNGRWQRSTLGWKTAADAWRERQDIHFNRRAFRRQVIDRACHIGSSSGVTKDLAWRLAIEQILAQWGLLKITKEGWS